MSRIFGSLKLGTHALLSPEVHCVTNSTGLCMGKGAGDLAHTPSMLFHSSSLEYQTMYIHLYYRV